MEIPDETLDTVAPVLTMIGQQTRLDPAWACRMIEAVADEMLPRFYRHAREVAKTAAERIELDLKLALAPGDRTEDVVRLAHSHAEAEQLDDALYWVGKAIEARPGDGEFLRFKASILERKRLFEEALRVAREAGARGADPEAIQSDIARIESGWIAQLRDAARSSDRRVSLGAHLTLLQQGPVKIVDLAAILFQIVRLYARPARTKA